MAPRPCRATPLGLVLAASLLLALPAPSLPHPPTSTLPRPWACGAGGGAGSALRKVLSFGAGCGRIPLPRGGGAPPGTADLGRGSPLACLGLRGGGEEDDTDEDEDSDMPEEPEPSSDEISEEEDDQWGPGGQPYNPLEKLEPEKAHYLLIRAAFVGDEEAAMSLVKDKGADPNAPAPQECHPAEFSALQFACAKGHVRLVQRLIAEGGGDVSRTNTRGATALHCAVFSKSVGVCEVLVNAGASLNATDHCGATPLQSAKAGSSPEVIDFLEKEMKSRNVEQLSDLFSREMDERAEEVTRFLREFDYVPDLMKDEKGELLPDFAAAFEKVRQSTEAEKRAGKLPRDFEDIMRNMESARPEDRARAEARIREIARDEELMRTMGVLKEGDEGFKE